MANPFLCVQIVPFQMYTNITLFICVEFNFMLARSVIYCRATTWLLKKKKKYSASYHYVSPLRIRPIFLCSSPPTADPANCCGSRDLGFKLKLQSGLTQSFFFFFFIYILSHSENRVMRFHENRLKSNSSALLDTVSTWSIVGWVIPEERHNCFFTILILQVKKFQKIYIGKKLQWH